MSVGAESWKQGGCKMEEASWTTYFHHTSNLWPFKAHIYPPTSPFCNLIQLGL